MIVLDGSEGEGGGQVLRSALSLSLITGQPFRLDKVRARRKPPGLKAQHLTCVRGAAALGGATVEGDSPGSHSVTFTPGPTRAGNFNFSVGTAGSTSLLLHCLVYPLALAGGGTLTLSGGSHVLASPSFDFLQRVWAPLTAMFGFETTLRLPLAGFFPEGGGTLEAVVAPASKPGDLDLAQRPVIDRLVVRSIVGGLSVDIASRQSDTARRALNELGLPVDVEVEVLPVAHSRGSAVVVIAESKGRGVAGFSSLGSRGVPAEDVGRAAAKDARAWVKGDGAVDEHLGDQLLLPMGLSAAGLLGPAREHRLLVHAVTDHLTTHARVLEAFLPIEVSIVDRLVRVSPRP